MREELINLKLNLASIIRFIRLALCEYQDIKMKFILLVSFSNNLIVSWLNNCIFFFINCFEIYQANKIKCKFVDIHFEKNELSFS